MEPFLSKSQKVKATCIVRSNDRVLLLRSDQVANPEHQPRGGYFYIPSFTVSFGEDPEITLQKTLEDYFGQSVKNISIVDFRQYMSDNNTIQIFEVVYTAETASNIQIEGRHGKFLFVEKHKLDSFMFPQERDYLEKYL